MDMWVDAEGLARLLDDLQRSQSIGQMGRGGDELTIRHTRVEEDGEDPLDLFRVVLSKSQVKRLAGTIPIATIEERYGLSS